MVGGVGQCHVASVRVCVRIDGNGLDTKPPRRLNNAAGDFTSIGYKQRIKHRLYITHAVRAGQSQWYASFVIGALFAVDCCKLEEK